MGGAGSTNPTTNCFALLSHQPLVLSRPTLDFIAGYFAAMDRVERTHALQTLELLISGYRHRRATTRYQDYRPQPSDTIRALAAYLANLVLLRALVHSSGVVELATLWPDQPNAWPATVNLWATGLDAEGYRAMISAFNRTYDRLFYVLSKKSRDDRTGSDDLNAAYLRGDREAERSLRFGYAALGERTYYDPAAPDLWDESTLAGLVRIAMGNPPRVVFDAPEPLPPLEVTSRIADVAYRILGLHCVRWDRREVDQFLRWLMELPVSRTPSTLPMALIEHVHPGLLDDLRAEPEGSWTTQWRTLLLSTTPDSVQSVDIAAAAEYLNNVMPGAWARPGDR